MICIFFEKNCLLRPIAATRLASPQRSNFPNNHMIKTSHTARRRLASSVLAATTLLISAQFASAAKVDVQIVAARSLMTTANIEAIAGIVKGISDQFGSGTIKMSGKNVKSIAAYAANAIIAKPTDALANRDDNKTDEIGEAIALIMNGMAGNAKFLKLGKAKSLTLTAMKGVLSTAKKTASLLSSSVFRDVGGSVGLTLGNNPALGGIEAKLATYLGKKAKSVAGKVNTVFIQTGLSSGFGGTPVANAIYEDGAISSLFLVTDPETDQRPA